MTLEIAELLTKPKPCRSATFGRPSWNCMTPGARHQTNSEPPRPAFNTAATIGFCRDNPQSSLIRPAWFACRWWRWSGRDNIGVTDKGHGAHFSWHTETSDTTTITGISPWQYRTVVERRSNSGEMLTTPEISTTVSPGHSAYITQHLASLFNVQVGNGSSDRILEKKNKSPLTETGQKTLAESDVCTPHLYTSIKTILLELLHFHLLRKTMHIKQLWLLLTKFSPAIKAWANNAHNYTLSHIHTTVLKNSFVNRSIFTKLYGFVFFMYWVVRC